MKPNFNVGRNLKLRSKGLIMSSEKLVQVVDYFAIVDPYIGYLNDDHAAILECVDTI